MVSNIIPGIPEPRVLERRGESHGGPCHVDRDCKCPHCECAKPMPFPRRHPGGVAVSPGVQGQDRHWSPTIIGDISACTGTIDLACRCDRDV